MQSRSVPAVIFVLVQAKAQANGGIASIGEIITRLKSHRPVIVTDRDTPLVESWRKRGIEVHIVPQSASLGLSKAPLGVANSYLRYFSLLRRLVRETGARVIHANDPAAFQLSLAPAKATGAKIILNLRDTIDPGRPPPSTRYRFLFSAADHVLYLSEDMADRWKRVAANAKQRFTVTYSVVDPEVFKPSPLPKQDGPPVVLLSGIIRPKKGQLDFLRHVAPKLAEKGIATWLAGDFDPQRDAYMKHCAAAAAPMGELVQFLGYRSNIPELMRQATVVAVSSRHEGLVRAMIEGMASARPVVSFDVCSAREILEVEAPGAGAVFDMGDFHGMARAIIRYAENPSAALQAGQTGAAAARRLFAPDVVVSRYEHVYKTLSQR